MTRPCGTRAAYMRGCRCEPCRAASVAYHRNWRADAPRPDDIEALLPVEPLGGWATRAACVGLPADWFFPEKKETGRTQIRAICRSCPVRVECLEWAVTNRIRDGWWGGVPPDERRKRRQADRMVSA